MAKSPEEYKAIFNRVTHNMEESISAFDNLAKTYDDYVSHLNYSGYEKAAQLVDELFPKKDGVKVLDIACGTGLVAESLRERGFTAIDGVDASNGMVEEAKAKGVYNKVICAFVGEDYPNLPFEDNTYDVITLAGAMAHNVVPCSGLHEMIRLVKPGGYIVNVFREEILEKEEEYAGRLVPLMNSLEKEGKWRQIAWTRYPAYFTDKVGISTIHQVC